MFCFDSLTNITFGYVTSNFSLHFVPPKLLLQILIHLCPTGMNGIKSIMGFLQNDLLQLCTRTTPTRPLKIIQLCEAKALDEIPMCTQDRLVIISNTIGLSFALERTGPLAAIIITIFYLLALYLSAI